jgi:hypothetical protein
MEGLLAVLRHHLERNLEPGIAGREARVELAQVYREAIAEWNGLLERVRALEACAREQSEINNR